MRKWRKKGNLRVALNLCNWEGRETLGRAEAGDGGVTPKPPTCKLCPNYILGNGFVRDTQPPSPYVAILLAKPSKTDILHNTAPSEGMERWWDRSVCRPLSTPLNSFLFSHVLRCQRDHFPTGRDARLCIQHCRRYDDALLAFDPNVFFITFSPQDTIETPAFFRLFVNTIRKALTMSPNNFYYRPCVLAGKEPMDLLMPEVAGGVKSWQGHFFYGKWPFKKG